MNTKEVSAENSHDVIYTLRTAHQNQTQLLMMADQKANILIGIVAIILTFILTNREFLDNISDQYIYLFGVFIFLEISALFMSLLVVLPRKKGKSNMITKGEDLPNPLYFGHFTELSESDYTSYLTSILTNNREAQDLLIRDMYNIGFVLKQKYGYLRVAYSLAIIGIFFLACYVALVMLKYA